MNQRRQFLQTLGGAAAVTLGSAVRSFAGVKTFEISGSVIPAPSGRLASPQVVGPLKERMTFSCEPGVYDPGFGGFRHSDTVVVRKNQGEILNRYPTRLDQMIIEI